jgi:heat shock protein HspQ
LPSAIAHLEQTRRSAYMNSMNVDLPFAHDPAAPGPAIRTAKFGIGDVVRHRLLDFRGVVFDIDPVFANSEEWYQSIPEGMRPHKDQPFYHLFAENDETTYVAYVSQQNLLTDGDGGPVSHPGIAAMFSEFRCGQYHLRPRLKH